MAKKQQFPEEPNLLSVAKPPETPKKFLIDGKHGVNSATKRNAFVLHTVGHQAEQGICFKKYRVALDDKLVPMTFSVPRRISREVSVIH